MRVCFLQLILEFFIRWKSRRIFSGKRSRINFYYGNRLTVFSHLWKRNLTALTHRKSLVSRNSKIEIIAIITIMIMIIFILGFFSSWLLILKKVLVVLRCRIFLRVPTTAKKLCFFFVMLTFHLNSFIILRFFFFFSWWRSKRVRPYCRLVEKFSPYIGKGFRENEKSNKNKDFSFCFIL